MKLLRETLLLSLLAACSGVDTVRDSSFDFDAVTSYAWKEGPRMTGTSDRDEEDRLLQQLRQRIDFNLEQRGWKQVEKAAADVVISARVRIETRVQQNDPNFALYVAEEYEQAILEIEVFNRLARKSVWRGQREDRLRYTSRAIGGVHQRFEPTGELRQWHIDKMADRVLDRLP